MRRHLEELHPDQALVDQVVRQVELESMSWAERRPDVAGLVWSIVVFVAVLVAVAARIWWTLS